jgi:predicted Rossmann fold flavoprotein
MPRQHDAIVVGAGAAGLMCAIEAGKRGRRVVVLEHNVQPGRKILISGGGRCNFTNFHTTPANFISGNPHFAKSALARYTPADFIRLIEKHKIAYHEKKLGQLFCDGSARAVVDMLQAECAAARVEIISGVEPRAVRRTSHFEVETTGGIYTAPVLVIATGGLSIPKMGATNFGYQVARQFGLKIVETRPALVPFILPGFSDLAGVSADVVAVLGKQRFRENMLFTHTGLSGPAMLQISSYWRPGAEISIDLLPGTDAAAAFLKRERATTTSVLAEYLPARLAGKWPSIRLAGASNAALEKLATDLHNWRVRPSGTEGYAKAEVTAGGVDTNELSSKTMESSKVPGLYVIGEVVDVTGHLGGFNFQWAWASGYAAGQAL